MPTLLSLPPELLAEILKWLSQDVDSLKNCAHTCSALLPICRYHLFAVADLSILDDADAQSFRDRITHIQVSLRSEALVGSPETYIQMALRLP